jgi:uncharacterized repeat protein (TIGR03806 family)
MARRTSTLLLLVATAACGGDSSTPAFGLERRTIVSGLAFPTGLASPTPVQPVLAFPQLRFSLPLFLTAPPDGSNRIVVVEQGGLVHVFPNDPAASATTVFLDLTSQVQAGGEEGLLGFAFHPDYATNGFFYTYHSAAGPRRSVLSRWRVSTNPDIADPNSQRILLEFDQPFANHNGGSLAFGPDGMLYIGSGDGGSANDPFDNAQSTSTPLGKILRLAPDGSIPADNPFAGSTQGERGEIWALGLRNPWRMSFDRATGALWVGDVGQFDVEEIDVVQKGGNYGWRNYEGTRENVNPGGVPATAFLPPVYEYPHALGASITGGHVYRGTAASGFLGSYVYGDYISGRIWALVHDGTQVISNTEIAHVTNPASFGEDEDGELYVCSFDGTVYALRAPAGGGPAAVPATLSATGLFTELTALRPAPGLIEYDVQAPQWSDGARKRRWLALPGTARIAFDPTGPFAFPVGTVLAEHLEIDVAPQQALRLETRVLVQHSSGWQGYTYRWNASGTDADLLTSGGTTSFSVPTPAGGSVQQTWTFPSSNDCLRCHTAVAGRVLGVRTRQLHRDFAYPLRTDDQLRAWNHIGLFTADIGDPAQYEALADPAAAGAPLATRARSYLAANCAHCHQPGGPTNVDLDLRFGIPVAQMNAVGVPSTTPAGGAGSALRIAPGGKEQSDLWQRMRRRDAFGMPPLATSVVDQAAVDLVGAWIDSGASN